MGADPDIPDTFPDDEIGTGRSLVCNATRFERNIQYRRRDEMSFTFFYRANGLDLCMRFTETGMITFAENFSMMNQHSPDRRIWGHITDSPPGESETS